MVNASDSAFEAAKIAYMGYGWLLQEMAKVAGWDKTIAINADAGGRAGELLATMVRAKCGEQKADAACVSVVLGDAYRSMAIDCEIQTSDGGAAIQIERCPFYEGLAASGIDHATIQKLCEGGAVRRSEHLHRLVPELTAKLRFREDPGDNCVEELIPAK